MLRALNQNAEGTVGRQKKTLNTQLWRTGTSMTSQRTIRETCATYTRISTTPVPQYLNPIPPANNASPYNPCPTPDIIHFPYESQLTFPFTLCPPQLSNIIIIFHSKRPLLHTHHTQDTAHGSMLPKLATVRAPKAIRHHTERRFFLYLPPSTKGGNTRDTRHKTEPVARIGEGEGGRQTGKQ